MISASSLRTDRIRTVSYTHLDVYKRQPHTYGARHSQPLFCSTPSEALRLVQHDDAARGVGDEQAFKQLHIGGDNDGGCQSSIASRSLSRPSG